MPRVDEPGEASRHRGRSLRIALADDDAATRDVLKKMLTHLGHHVVAAAETGRELLEQSRLAQPDLVIADIRMPDMDGLEAAAAIYDHRPTPVILVTGYTDREFIERAEQGHVLAYLVKPIKSSDLEPAIILATRRFQEFKTLQDEAADLKKALADRKVIERAKGLLMKHLNIDEPEAFRRLQKLASSKNQKLIDIAQMILTAAEALNG
jgi:response regulator NasT